MPRYLKKSSCLGIKGDVNAIGRVHAYLEAIGVINTGHVTAAAAVVRPALVAGNKGGKVVRKEARVQAKGNKPVGKDKDKAKEKEGKQPKEDDESEDDREADKKDKPLERKNQRPPAVDEFYSERFVHALPKGWDDAVDSSLDKERRKKKVKGALRTEACLASNHSQLVESKETYMGGMGVFVCMLSPAEMNQRHRVMETLHAAQLDSKKKVQRMAQREREQQASVAHNVAAAAAVIDAAEAATVSLSGRDALVEGSGGAGGGSGGHDEQEDGQSRSRRRPHEMLLGLDHATLKKYRRQFRLDLALQAPRNELAAAVASHFSAYRVPQEAATVNKFIEVVKRRKEIGGGAGNMVVTLESKRALQRALQQPEHGAAGEAQEKEETEEEEEETYTILQKHPTAWGEQRDGGLYYDVERSGKEEQIEFKLGATCEVLYDDGFWYPGVVCSYTETTGKFRFKLTEGSNTRFAEWLPHEDIKVTQFASIASDDKADPKAIQPGGPPAKSHVDKEIEREAHEAQARQAGNNWA